MVAVDDYEKRFRDYEDTDVAFFFSFGAGWSRSRKHYRNSANAGDETRGGIYMYHGCISSPVRENYFHVPVM